MKAREENGQVKLYPELPRDWKHHLNFRVAPLELAQAEGFYDVVEPHYDPALQRLGEIFFERDKKAFTYPVVDKTPGELAVERDLQLRSREQDFDVRSVRKLLDAMASALLNIPGVTQGDRSAIEALRTCVEEKRL